MTLSPYISGNTKIAADILNSPDGKIIATIGDSITARMGHTNCKRSVKHSCETCTAKKPN